MSSVTGKTVLRNIKRTYVNSAQTAVAFRGFEYQKTVLENNLTVVTFNEDAPLSRVTVAFKAGSRYETGTNKGITNILRSSCGLGTKRFSKFGISRNLDLLGARLSANAEREIFSYTMESSQDTMFTALQYLPSIVVEQRFKPWELKDNLPRIKLELAAVTEEHKAFDLLHTAAYKTGLGNSLYCRENKVDKIIQEDLMHYVGEHFTTKRGIVVGSGIDHELLVEFSRVLTLSDLSGPPGEKAVFYGGELRSSSPSGIAYYAVAGEAPGFRQKEAVAYAVVSQILASPPPAKYADSKGIIGQPLSKAGIAAGLTGININYSDSGLVGFFMTTSAADIAEAAKIAIKTFVSANITDEDVARGKAKLKVKLLSNVEESGILDMVARQAGESSIQTPNDLVAAIDAVSAADVKQAYKKLANGKLAVAATGGIDGVAYYEALK